jgi:hypothetical protein
LTSINVQLASLKTKANFSTKGLERSIARTQRLVVHSVNIVHQFARELRPTVLDDLGLIPALHTFMKRFRSRPVSPSVCQAFAAVKQVNGDIRTVLYRVAQEGSQQHCPACASLAGGGEYLQAGRHRLHDHKRQRQRLSKGTPFARQREQTTGIARHEGTVGDDRRQFHRHFRAGQGHDSPGASSTNCPNSGGEGRSADPIH